MNLLDLPGPSFLLSYVILLVAGIVVGVVLRWLLRGPAARPGESPPPLSPYEIACLSGGRKLAVDAAIATLVQRQVLQTDTATNHLVSPSHAATPTDPLERAIHRTVAGRPQGATVREIRKEAGGSVAGIEDRLLAEGLYVASGRKLLARVVPFALILAIGIFGLQKVLLGMERQKPVFFLIALLIVTFLAAITFLAKPIVRSRRGEQVLSRLKADHQALRTTATANPETLGGPDLTLAMCLFGVGMLTMGPLSDLRRMMQPPSQGGSGCGGAACGASGCGGGDGGGGGGCGGCGGGGD